MYELGEDISMNSSGRGQHLRKLGNKMKVDLRALPPTEGTAR